MDKNIDRIQLLLRIGVSFAIIYPAVSAYFNPDAWIGYFPDFVFSFISELFLLYIFGVVMIIIGFWILSGKKIFIPSIIATITLTSIVLFNISQIDILFRDISIAIMSFSLVLLNK